jgi:hypothetical protein
VLLDALIALAAVLFITFPAQLFNSTYKEYHDDIARWWRRRRGGMYRPAPRRPLRTTRLRNRLVFAVVIFSGALLGGLLDPHFGLNGASALTLVATIVATVAAIAIPVATAVAYRRARRIPASGTLLSLPSGLLIAALCVAVSRLSDFQPGYLYGCVCGVAFVHALERTDRGRLALIGTVVSLVLALVAWFAWVPLENGIATAGVGTVLAADILGAVFVGSLVGTVIGLLPLGFLAGGTLIRWSRTVWVATFAAACFCLVAVMLNPASASTHTGSAPLFTTIALFVVFGGASVGFHQWAKRVRRAAALTA